MTFENVQREYGISGDDIRAALKFAGELVEQEQHHPVACVRHHAIASGRQPATLTRAANGATGMSDPAAAGPRG